jgi:hypothetical protein
MTISRTFRTIGACCAVALLSRSSIDLELTGRSGTLLIAIPSSEGLVVAGDTRHTTYGISCDSGTKLFVPANMPGTIFGLTGLANFQAVKYPFVGDPCQEIESSPIIFSVEPVVRAFLEGQTLPISTLDLTGLANELTQALSKFLTTFPIDRGPLAARSSVFTVVLASFDAATHTSMVREISVVLPTPNEVSVQKSVDVSYKEAGQPDWRAFGQGNYLVEHVLNGPGKQFLDDNYRSFETVKTIGELSASLAASTAENLIVTTSKTSELIAIPAGVGGHIDVYLLGKDGTRKLR